MALGPSAPVATGCGSRPTDRAICGATCGVRIEGRAKCGVDIRGAKCGAEKRGADHESRQAQRILVAHERGRAGKRDDARDGREEIEARIELVGCGDVRVGE